MTQDTNSTTFFTGRYARNLFLTRAPGVFLLWTVVSALASGRKPMFILFVEIFLVNHASTNVTHTLQNFTWFALVNHKKLGDGHLFNPEILSYLQLFWIGWLVSCLSFMTYQTLKVYLTPNPFLCKLCFELMKNKYVCEIRIIHAINYIELIFMGKILKKYFSPFLKNHHFNWMTLVLTMPLQLVDILI